MAKKLGLITVHGMGGIDKDYYKDLQNIVSTMLGNKWGKISMKPVFYDFILEKPQEKLWETMVKYNKLDNEFLRKMFLSSFSDATSLEHSLKTDKELYIKVQFEIYKSLDEALNAMGGDLTKPVVLIAYSLGCQVISNYIWDAQNNLNLFGIEGKKYLQGKSINDFHRLKTLSNLITIGCNIPLFVAGLEKRLCFNKPNKNFIWDNYYDEDDVLGWPLKQLDESYNLVNDHNIDVGSILTSWNFMCHLEYWKSKTIIKNLSRIILEKI